MAKYKVGNQNIIVNGNKLLAGSIVKLTDKEAELNEGMISPCEAVKEKSVEAPVKNKQIDSPKKKK